MILINKAILFVMALSLAIGCTSVLAAAPQNLTRWSKEKADKWYRNQPWLVGCNFIPGNAINQLEMWQPDTFDPQTIDRELALAAGIGFNTVRVYLHDLAWQADPEGFKKRIDEFLSIAARHNIRPLFVFFDDCWNDNPKIGKQPAPTPGVHNSGWLQSPGKSIVNDPKKWPRLEKYVKDIISTFANDQRILLWDLYNEPGNGKQDDKSLPLVRQTFLWARSVNPSQPLTVGLWNKNFKELNKFQLQASDVVTFHNYEDQISLLEQIIDLQKQQRPIICTEWMARTADSKVQTHLPIFKLHNVGCVNWGLVSGKTNTIFPWGSKKDSPEPKLWFHDLFRPDGSPYDPAETKLFKILTDR